MTQKKFRKLGFFSALCICIGSVVGVGIFFKNASINGTTTDGISWLFAWIVGGVTALLVAIHFGKISQITGEDEADCGLRFWSAYFTRNKKNKAFAKTVAFNYNFFYNTIIVLVLSFFCAEILLNFIFITSGQTDWYNSFPIWGVILISIGILFCVSLGNFLSTKYTSVVSSTSMILKTIPLLFAIWTGIIMPNTHNAGGGNDFATIADPFDSFKGLILALPSVLFAFDAFIGIGAYTDKVKNGEKAIPKIIVISMISVLVLYVLIAISSILHSTNPTFISNVISDVFPPGAAKGINIFVAFFLLISVYGTTNGVNAVFLNEMRHSVNKEIFVGSKKVKQKMGVANASAFYSFLFLAFWMLIIYVPTVFINNDQLVDGFSNFPVVFFFIIYSIIIYYYWKNEYSPLAKNKTSKLEAGVYGQHAHKNHYKSYSFLVFLTMVVVVFAIVINFTVVILNSIQIPNETSSWGLYLSSRGHILSNLEVLIIYICATFGFLIFPFLNNQLLFLEKRRMKFK